jgi:hypothetical protein
MDPASKSWWESPAIRGLEAIAIVVALIAGVGGLFMSGAAYRDQQNQVQSEQARSVVLLPRL